MRYILLSADSLPTLYEAPDAVAEALWHFADQFLEEINRPDSPFWHRVTDAGGGSYDCLSYSERDFVAWLNRRPETQYFPVQEAASLPLEEREIILETALRERNIPYAQQRYPWFNF
ncbi:MAG: hypothetical protein IK099_00405 [Clostridia bacterium]|nr:hypothetical protein [Clostridia bacterium]